MTTSGHDDAGDIGPVAALQQLLWTTASGQKGLWMLANARPPAG
jgi:hypothetical protein